jgi:hypothetical protein
MRERSLTVPCNRSALPPGCARPAKSSRTAHRPTASNDGRLGEGCSPRPAANQLRNFIGSNSSGAGTAPGASARARLLWRASAMRRATTSALRARVATTVGVFSLPPTDPDVRISRIRLFRAQIRCGQSYRCTILGGGSG